MPSYLSLTSTNYVKNSGPDLIALRPLPRLSLASSMSTGFILDRHRDNPFGQATMLPSCNALGWFRQPDQSLAGRSMTIFPCMSTALRW